MVNAYVTSYSLSDWYYVYNYVHTLMYDASR